MSDTTGPIGIFDSGFGGLTVARSVVDQMPNEDIVYLGGPVESSGDRARREAWEEVQVG